MATYLTVVSKVPELFFRCHVFRVVFITAAMYSPGHRLIQNSKYLPIVVINFSIYYHMVVSGHFTWWTLAILSHDGAWLVSKWSFHMVDVGHSIT